MPKRFQTAIYVFTFLAVCVFLLGWKLFAVAQRPADLADYENRLATTAANISAPAVDESLRIYAVNVVRIRPFEKPLIGYGTYLGQGLVLTAAHVVDRWPFATNPRVLIAGQDLPAKVIKKGAIDQIDLALLSVEHERLPVSLRLRQNSLCKGPLQIGANVIVVYPERIVRSQIISPQLIEPQLRMKFGTLINEPGDSGSGVFSAERKCLLGVMSQQITKYAYQNQRSFEIEKPHGFAGYFVPVPMITSFISVKGTTNK